MFIVDDDCSDTSSCYGDGCMQMAVMILLMTSMLCIIVMWNTGLADVTAAVMVYVVNEQTVMAAMSFAFAEVVVSLLPFLLWMICPTRRLQ